MAMKHNVSDTDLHFVVDPVTRNINRQSDAKDKAYLMQYDHNSERVTFDVPRKIEEHDMSLCDVIQIHYENSSSGTSASLRTTYRGIYTVEKEDITVEDDMIAFSWLIPENATMFAGSLKFQLKFICHSVDFEDVEEYRWHTNVNSDISIMAGLSYTADTLSPSATATLQSLEINEMDNGIEVVLDGRVYNVYHGHSGVYVGSGDMPEGYNVQIDPDGQADSGSSSMEAIDLTTSIDENSTDDQIPSAKAVYNAMPAKRIESPDSDNPVFLRDLDSGMYVLYGKFKPYDGAEDTFTFSTGMLVSVIRTDTISFVQIFYAKYNTMQYLEIEDSTYARHDAKLANMESTTRMITEIDETSDDVHYPTAKAVYTVFDTYSTEVNALLENLISGESTDEDSGGSGSAGEAYPPV